MKSNIKFIGLFIVVALALFSGCTAGDNMPESPEQVPSQDQPEQQEPVENEQESLPEENTETEQEVPLE